MRIPVFAIILSVITSAVPLRETTHSFREQQLKYIRVRTSAKDKDEVMRSKFTGKNVAYPPRNILFRAFKKESALEMWAANDANLPFVPIWTYKICATSGTLGPKRRFGDVQVPEGFYSLDWFNPQSNFFLSLHISYPNPADRILGSHEPGRRYLSAWELRHYRVLADNG